MRAATLAVGMVTLLSCVGCGAFYRHQVVREEFSLYGNHDPVELKATGDFIEKVFDAYRKIFPNGSPRVPAVNIIYQEDELSRERIFTSEIRQEGYYLPIFRLIHLSPQHGAENEEDRQTVILHEIAHHFLVSIFPDTRTQYWLNEGLACALEVSFFSGDDTLNVPLYHLTLHQHARQALIELGDRGFLRELGELVEGSWFRFHRQGDKTRHYAMAWSLVYYLLESTTGSLEERLETILALSNSELAARAANLPAFLRQDPDVILDRLARQPTLEQWALRQWQQIPTPNGALFLRHLLPYTESSRAAEREEALSILTHSLNGRMIGVTASRIRSLRTLLARALRRGTPGDQIAVVRQLKSPGRHPVYLRPLVNLLESGTPELRAEAAGALSRLTHKPTITRPGFWKGSTSVERRSEVNEWQVYLLRKGL